MIARLVIFAGCIVTLVSSNCMQGVQEGTLILNNQAQVLVAYRFSTEIDSGNIKGAEFVATGKKIICPSKDPNQYIPIQENERVVIDSPIRIGENMGGVGSVWGSIIELTLVNMETRKAHLYKLAKAIEYTIVKNAQDNLVLVDQDGNSINQV